MPAGAGGDECRCSSPPLYCSDDDGAALHLSALDDDALLLFSMVVAVVCVGGELT